MQKQQGLTGVGVCAVVLDNFHRYAIDCAVLHGATRWHSGQFLQQVGNALANPPYLFRIAGCQQTPLAQA